MDFEDEHEAGEGSSGAITLTGFLFGNIDEKGALTEDFLDEVGYCDMVVTLVIMLRHPVTY